MIQLLSCQLLFPDHSVGVRLPDSGHMKLGSAYLNCQCSPFPLSVPVFQNIVYLCRDKDCEYQNVDYDKNSVTSMVKRRIICAVDIRRDNIS